MGIFNPTPARNMSNGSALLYFGNWDDHRFMKREGNELITHEMDEFYDGTTRRNYSTLASGQLIEVNSSNMISREDYFIRRTTNRTTPNGTITKYNDDILTLPVVTTKRYEIEGMLNFSVANTANFYFYYGINVPNSIGGAYIGGKGALTGFGIFQPFLQLPSTYINDSSSFEIDGGAGGSVALLTFCYFKALITPQVNGNITLWYYNKDDGGSTTENLTIYAGSHFHITSYNI